MRIQTFTNGKGLIYGDDPKRVSCDKAGVLKIGSNVIEIPHDSVVAMPRLCGGYSCKVSASFTAEDGSVYPLENVVVKEGRIAPPPQTSVQLMELRLFIEELRAECKRIDERVEELSKIFDTNSLNFLIKGE